MEGMLTTPVYPPNETRDADVTVSPGKVLKELGATPEEVAAALRASGIRGVRNTVRFLNPIVRFAKWRLRFDVYDMDVIQPDVFRIKYRDGREKEVPLSPAVREFLNDFHRGVYPELILPEENV
jgi:hypothetical protein